MQGRQEVGSWRGPYKLLSVNGEACVLALPHGNTKFQTTVVKPYFRATDVKDTESGVAAPEDGDTIIVDTRPLVPTQALNRRRVVCFGRCMPVPLVLTLRKPCQCPCSSLRRRIEH
jgi:hypothetical protein